MKEADANLGFGFLHRPSFEAPEETGDRIRDGAQNWIKGGRGAGGDGRDLTLGIRGYCELPPQRRRHDTPACVHMYILGFRASLVSGALHVPNIRLSLHSHPPYQIIHT